MKQLRTIFLLLTLIASAVGALAQRHITPVNTPVTATQPINENRAQGDTIDHSRLVEMLDNKGNKILVDTVTGREFVDTLANKKLNIPKMQQPLLYSATVSADLLTPLLRALGQSYGVTEFAAELNLHNRYIPTIEVGLGQASSTPDDNNYTYTSPLSPFFRIGINYNFLYNSNPDYMVYAGIRYGFSPFKYSVTNIDIDNSYWGENYTTSFAQQSATAGYFELLLGLRVRVFNNVSFGWTVRYRSILHESTTDIGKAWYIPGYGSRNSSLGATFSVAYTIPIAKKPAAELSQTPEAKPTTDAKPVDTSKPSTPDTNK